jgi:hypothetical protein
MDTFSSVTLSNPPGEWGTVMRGLAAVTLHNPLLG